MKKYILCLALAALILGGCSKHLELEESQYNTKEYQFSTFENTKKVATNVYGYLRDELMDVEGTMRDAATDDAMYVWPSNNIRKYYDGSWSPSNVIDDVWDYYYQAIRSSNYFLENCPEDFPESIWLTDYNDRVRQLKNYPLEIRILRAYFHFELLKRYNNIVIADKSFTISEVNSLNPSNYQTVAQWIINECDQVIPNLPISYAQTRESELGRVTRGVAMALKTRVLLYAASPLNNENQDRNKWFSAAEAAKDLIDANIYSLVNEPVTNNENAKGLILGKWNSISNDFERSNYPVGYEGGNTGITPSQNLVEAFDMLDGTMFNWENINHRNSMLDATKRDPRFAHTILYSGAMFKGRKIQAFTGGEDGLPKQGASSTSYYIRKHIREDASLVEGASVAYQHIFPLFRYEEVLLNYAESLAEATQNPRFTGGHEGITFTLSPLEAVNLVRSRVGMPGLPITIDFNEFRDRVRRERRVELAFEGHRFWDIRRWKQGGQTKEIYGVKINMNFDGFMTFTRELLQTRIWDEKMNFYPIADVERFKNNNLIQNTGW